MLAVLAALASALLVAAASVLQHRAARGHQPGVQLFRVFRQPLWLVGAGLGVAGFVFHLIALAGGQLSVVQPLLVSGLLYALPLSLLIEHRAIHAADLAWAATVVAGLAIFLLTARPARGHAVANLDVLLWCTILIAAAALLAVGAAARWPSHRAACLGFGAGAGYGLMAALLKTSIGVLPDGWSVLSQWPLYAVIPIAVAAITVNQLAFNAGPLASSLPLITIVDPVVAITVGAIAFGEETASAPVLLLGQIGGFALMSLGVVALARRTPGDERGEAVQ